MAWLGTLFLYLHIASVIVAFGPTIAFPFFGDRAAKEPMHGNFVLRASEFISSRVVEPVAAVVFLTGVGLIVTRGYNPLEDLWVAIAIVLFLITFAYANLVQGPTVKRMIELTSQPSPPVTAAASSGEPATAAGPGPGGPPPEFLALGAKAARGGQFMLVMLFTILALMVVKPF
jgi:hypothetical protein